MGGRERDKEFPRISRALQRDVGDERLAKLAGLPAKAYRNPNSGPDA